MLFESNFLPVYFSTTIAASILTAILIFLSGIKQQMKEYFSLAILSLVVIVYQYCTWRYHQSSTALEAVLWLKWQTSTVFIALPFYFYTFAFWAKFRYTEIFTTFFSVSAFILLSLNLASEYSLRYSATHQLIRRELWNGEFISLLRGTPPIYGYLTQILSFTIMISLLFILYKLLRRNEKIVSLILSGILILQIGTSYLGAQIDIGKVDFIYLGALPLIFLNICFCALIATSFRAQAIQYTSLHQKASNLENTMTTLAQVTSTSNSDLFYNKMLESLFNLTGCTYIFIGLVDEDSKDKITTKVALKKGDLIDNFSYMLAQTPCEIVMNNEVCIHNQDVVNKFPKDLLLADMKIEAYFGTPILGSEGEMVGILALLDTKPFYPDERIIEAIQVFASRAASEMRRDVLESKLRRMAYIDYTTGLPNKAHLFEVLNETFKKREFDKSNSMLMLVDIDNFTDINRIFGYEKSDIALRELGQRLLQYQNNNLFIARQGGDEFLLLFYNISSQPSAFMKVHWEAIRAIFQRPIYIGDQVINIACSMGTVVFPEQTGRVYDVIQCAEMALSQSKLNGRKQASMFDPLLLETQVRRQYIDSELRKALKESNQLWVAYQPKTNSKGEMIGAEALIRWKHPVEGFISPAEFIPVAEQSGIILQIGDWVINHVCQQINQWKMQGFITKIAINLSAEQLIKDDFTDKLLSLTHRYDVSPNLIELELTESGILNDVNKAKSVLNILKNKGFTIALDDFGTGYSSLSYLRQLPLNVLKVDKSFVDNISEESSRELIKTIINIGKQLSLSIVAEGTEYKEQVELLAEMGCDVFQGYYFSKPLPPSDLLNWTFEKPN